MNFGVTEYLYVFTLAYLKKIFLSALNFKAMNQKDQDLQFIAISLKTCRISYLF